MAEIWGKALWVYGLTVAISLVVAVLIKFIVAVLAEGDRRWAAPKASASPAPAPAPAPARMPGKVPAEHVAVITAAAYAMFGAHRKLHIEAHRGPAWVNAGRLAHHTSHSPHSQSHRH